MSETVAQRIEKACNKICSEYCKYNEKYEKELCDNECLEKICETCPLLELA